MRTSPLSLLADLAVWPITFRPLALVGVAVVGVVVWLGVSRLGEMSIEHALRRAGLVAQLRFAVTLQDVRTVVLLRRQLSQENPRQDPWIRIGRPRSARPIVPAIWKRDWQSYLRFPLPRLLRMLILAAVAGVALGMTWRGVIPAIVVAGIALYLAAYDAAEPTAQEVDHPTRWESFPESPGRLLSQHLPASFTIMLVLSLVAAAASLVLVPADVVVSLIWMVLFAAAASAIAATISTAQGAPDVAGISGLGPDLMGWVMLARLVIPPAITIVALLPLLAAGTDANMLDTKLVANDTSYVMFLLLGSFFYLYTRKPKHL